MTLTIHALAGLHIGSRAGLKRWPAGTIIVLGMLGHMIFDRLPHNHLLPTILDLACLTGLTLAAFARRFGPRRVALLGLAASVLPDALHLLPTRLDLLHFFPGMGSLRTGVWPVLTQIALGMGLIWPILIAGWRRRANRRIVAINEPEI